MNTLRILFVFLTGVLISFGQGVNPLNITRISPTQFQLSWYANTLRPYQLENSPDLASWVELGNPIVGTGATSGVLVTKTADKMFFRLRKGAMRSEFDGIAMSRQDDHTYPEFAVPGILGSPAEVELGFQINFFGELYSKCYVNNNGNISFGNPYTPFTPQSLYNLGEKIIAPFWADVDTRNLQSNVTRFSAGGELVNGRPAFGVTYKNVGYFAAKADKLNSFQVIVIQRYDTGVNNFDIEFNYNAVSWETGILGINNGYGEPSARVGITNGGTFFTEITGSGVPLSFLDTILFTGTPNLATGLIYNSHNSSIPGRYVFQMRGGNLTGSFAVNAGPDQTLAETHSAAIQLNGSINPANYPGLSFRWIQKDNYPTVTFSNDSILNPIVTIQMPGDYEFELTASGGGTLTTSARDTVKISHPGWFDVYAGDFLFLTAPQSLTQTLHGSASFSGGVPVSVHWEQIQGDAVTISNPNTLDPTVTLPGPGEYLFTMSATTNHASPFTTSSLTAIYYESE